MTKLLFFAILLTASLHAQSLRFYIDGSNGAAPAGQLQPLGSSYPFPNTPVGESSSVTVRVVNTSSSSTVQINDLYVSSVPSLPAQDNDFIVTGLKNATLAPMGTKLFTLTFTPTRSVTITGYFQVSVTGAAPAAVSTLTGTGTGSQVSLTCTDKLFSACDGKTPVQASSSITFGNGVYQGAAYTIPFTVTNATAAAIPKPVLEATQFTTPAFTSSALAQLASTIAPGASASFNVVFTPQAGPGVGGPELATLVVGPSTFGLQGTLQTVDNNDPLQPTCVYSTGKPCQASTSPNALPNTLAVGPNLGTLTLVFQIKNNNPAGTAFADYTLAAPPTVSDPAFTLTAPTLGPINSTAAGQAVTANQPVVITPGNALNFRVTFTGTAVTTGTLTVGAGISYILAAQPPPAVGSAGSDLPGVALMCGNSPCAGQTFTSQQQVQATLQVSSPTTASATLALSFNSLVSGVANDPAITFISPFNTRQIGPLNFGLTSTTGAFAGGQSQFTFQTGTTAGNIVITLTDAATQQSFPFTLQVPPTKVQITSATAVRQSPNLVLTINGYDNTYTAGAMSFTFTGLSGKALTPNAIQVDSASSFHQYFYGSSNQAGGAFTLQVTFPVSGDVTQVGSVTANISNSVGQTTVTQAFQ